MSIPKAKKPQPLWLTAPILDDEVAEAKSSAKVHQKPISEFFEADEPQQAAIRQGSLEDVIKLLGQAWNTLSQHSQGNSPHIQTYRKPAKTVKPLPGQLIQRSRSDKSSIPNSTEFLHGAKTKKSNRASKVTKSLPTSMQDKLIRIVGAIESRNNHSAINTNPAGNGIAYGSLQVLSRTGGLDLLLQMYAKAGGQYAQKLLAFGSATSVDVSKNPEFQTLLRQAGKDPVMKQVQTAFFREQYLQPALRFGQNLGLRLPSSYLIVFDAFIHYGANKPWLRRKLSTLVRQQGEVKGMEAWIQWMRRSLQNSYGRRFGANSIEARYNVWRADALGRLQRLNPHLHGSIKLKAPQWTRPVIIADSTK